MHYFKRSVSGFSLGVLFAIGTAFYPTPPANAQPIPIRDADCVLQAVAYAANMRADLVSELSGAMIGPPIDVNEIQGLFETVGVGRRFPIEFFTREALIRYLRSNNNAAYVVGWTEGSEVGHVINARVINGGEPVFIDAQCGRFTTVPENQSLYYAWFVEPILFGEAERMMGDLSRRDDPDATSSGGFTTSCQNIALFTNVDRFNSVNLSANCRNNEGTFTPTAINLSDSIINSFGGLLWQENGGFGGSVRNCRLRDSDDVTVLQCEANDGSGNWKNAAINLDKRIANDNGQLAVRK
jgi:hypothetical protein